MLLYLLRHADAVAVAASDAERELTPKGIRQVERMAKFCLGSGIEPKVILTSPLRRAQQTASIMARELSADVTVAPFLTAGMHPADAVEELRSYVEFESIMLVGHQPDFSDLAAALLGLPSHEQIRFRKAGLACIDVNPGGTPGNARLDLLISAKDLGK